MTREQFHEAVRKHCDEHAILLCGQENFCWTTRRRCVFFDSRRDFPKCEHFTKKVLPLFMGQMVVK